jgi:hypothetical protein
MNSKVVKIDSLKVKQVEESCRAGLREAVVVEGV